MTIIVKPSILRELNSVAVLAFSKSTQQQYLAFRKSTPGVAVPGSMLNVFLVEIHGAIHVTNPGFIYGAMLFMTFFWRLLLALYGMILWTLIGKLIGMLFGMLIIVQNNANF